MASRTWLITGVNSGFGRELEVFPPTGSSRIGPLWRTTDRVEVLRNALGVDLRTGARGKSAGLNA